MPWGKYYENLMYQDTSQINKKESWQLTRKLAMSEQTKISLTMIKVFYIQIRHTFGCFELFGQRGDVAKLINPTY